MSYYRAKWRHLVKTGAKLAKALEEVSNPQPEGPNDPLREWLEKCRVETMSNLEALKEEFQSKLMLAPLPKTQEEVDMVMSADPSVFGPLINRTQEAMAVGAIHLKPDSKPT